MTTATEGTIKAFFASAATALQRAQEAEQALTNERTMGWKVVQ